MINGVINVYKEEGYTSHDVVAKLRKIVGQKKIGHTGTLDPGASGVLPVCLGKATKIAGLLTEETKTYETVMLLGTDTDTQDISGKVLSRRDVNVTEEDVRAALGSFEGDQMQVPPMYSARKKNGKKLYELAREGIEVEREARPVHFSEITLLALHLPRARLRVTCSKGTYIRTLCHDIGEKLGCGGCMEQLVRTRVGQFTLADARKIGEIEKMRDAGALAGCVIPVDEIFGSCPAVYTIPRADGKAHNGNLLEEEELEGMRGEKFVRGIQYRVYDSEKRFVGIYMPEENGQLKARKMFFDSGA